MNNIKPTVGRIVLYNGPYNGGDGFSPAMVTRVWDDNMVNLMVMPDMGSPTPVGSVTYREETRQGVNTWRWMPYQKQVAAGEIEPTRHA